MAIDKTALSLKMRISKEEMNFAMNAGDPIQLNSTQHPVRIPVLLRYLLLSLLTSYYRSRREAWCDVIDVMITEGLGTLSWGAWRRGDSVNYHITHTGIYKSVESARLNWLWNCIRQQLWRIVPLYTTSLDLTREKEEIWISPMTKAPTPQKNPKSIVTT